MSAGAASQPVVVELADRLLAQPLDVEGAGARRNGSAARPPAPGRSGRRCSAAPPRRAAAPRGCRRPGSGRGTRTGAAPAGRRSGTTETICGITSPARCSTTVSPMRTSLRAISSSLCRVARVHQHAADIDRLRARATGVSAPVRPTWMRMSCSTVVACSAGNFHAIAQRGVAADEAQPALQGEIVDLVDHAVDVVGAGRRARRPSRAWNAAAASASPSSARRAG